LATVIDGPWRKAQTIGVSLLEISLGVMEIPAPGASNTMSIPSFPQTRRTE
jgi:hypothetical protein